MMITLHFYGSVSINGDPAPHISWWRESNGKVDRGVKLGPWCAKMRRGAFAISASFDRRKDLMAWIANNADFAMKGE